MPYIDQAAHQPQHHWNDVQQQFGWNFYNDTAQKIWKRITFLYLAHPVVYLEKVKVLLEKF